MKKVSILFPMTLGSALAMACSSRPPMQPSSAPQGEPPAAAMQGSQTPPPGSEPPTAGEVASPSEHQHEESESSPTPGHDEAAPMPATTPGKKVAQPKAAAHHPDAAREEPLAFQSAKPILESHCGRCHTSQGTKTSKGALKHFSMDSYPYGGHHADELSKTIRKVLGADGSRPTMPKDKPGAVKGKDLELILAWADAQAQAPGAATTSGNHDSTPHQH